MKAFASSLLLTVLVISIASAQNKQDYKTKFTQGNYLVLEHNYKMALDNYLGAYEDDSTNSNINYKIGYCYLHIPSEKGKATPYLEKAVKDVTANYDDIDATVKSAPVYAYYYLGKALHLDYRFDTAIVYFNKFKKYLKPRKDKKLLKDVNRQIEMCNNAKIFYNAPTNAEIVNMGDSINSPYPDYSPVVSADESTLIFTSRRPGGVSSARTPDGDYYEDIYISYKKKNGSWTSPKSISPNINTADNEASIGLSADGQTLFIYKDDDGGDIYTSQLDGDTWSKPQKMGSDIDTKAFEPSACLSADGKTLYFVSDRKGGMGGRDIWRCVRLPNGMWSKALDLGAPINTPYDEDAPFIHPDGKTLFFSSKGHNSMGGFDIFFSVKSDTGWSTPQNVGYPINTPGDDIYYSTSPDGKRGYFSSDRPGGYGGQDIYEIILKKSVEKPLTLIKGTITPPKGQELPDNIHIIVTNNQTGQEVGDYKPIHRNGSFTIIIPPNSDYSISCQNNGVEFYHDTFFVPADAAYNEINKNIMLNPISLATNDSNAVKTQQPSSSKDTSKVKQVKPKTIAVKNNTEKGHGAVKGMTFKYYFGYNEKEIDGTNKDYQQYLNTLSTYIKKQKGKVKIYLLSSASQVPTKAYKNNKQLSKARAHATKQQLIDDLKKKGIDTSTITFKTKAEVLGPQYHGDYQKNKSVYEKYQYVRVKVLE